MLTFSPILPTTYLAVDGASTTLSLLSNSLADIGDHFITMTVSLANFPTVASLTKNFKVTIITNDCIITSIAFSTPPANIYVDPGITPQPALSSFTVSTIPACPLDAVTFTFVNTPPIFLSLTNLADRSGRVQVDSALRTENAIYPMTLRAEADGVSVDANFQVEIPDPCHRVVLQASTPSPLVDMSIVRNFDSSKT